MAIYIYRPVPSESARALAAAVEGRKVSHIPKKLIRQDVVIGWGVRVPALRCKVLNGILVRGKFTDAEILTNAGVPTITVSRTHQDGWIGRSNHHVGGNDLLWPPRTVDYWVKREEIVKEFRVHSFKGRSLRAGIKVHRTGFETPHEWIRSWDGGWRISYDGESVKQKHRDLAHRAIEALGLDFGAVDIGQLKDKTLIVLEVNRAPGIENGTVGVYAKAIREWADSREVE